MWLKLGCKVQPEGAYKNELLIETFSHLDSTMGDNQGNFVISFFFNSSIQVWLLSTIVLIVLTTSNNEIWSYESWNFTNSSHCFWQKTNIKFMNKILKSYFNTWVEKIMKI